MKRVLFVSIVAFLADMCPFIAAQPGFSTSIREANALPTEEMGRRLAFLNSMGLAHADANQDGCLSYHELSLIYMKVGVCLDIGCADLAEFSCQRAPMDPTTPDCSTDTRPTTCAFTTHSRSISERSIAYAGGLRAAIGGPTRT